jgi:hypothetical protein
VQLNE